MNVHHTDPWSFMILHCVLILRKAINFKNCRVLAQIRLVTMAELNEEPGFGAHFQHRRPSCLSDNPLTVIHSTACIVCGTETNGSQLCRKTHCPYEADIEPSTEPCAASHEDGNDAESSDTDTFLTTLISERPAETFAVYGPEERPSKQTKRRSCSPTNEDGPTN